jgi:two-component system LytT family response regulator
VDDEPLARRRLQAMLATEADLDLIGEAATGPAAVEAIAGQRPDLVFLDVQMPGLDGFEVLRCTARAHRPAVVFVTAYDQHAIRAFDVQAVDYLVKPVTAARLREAVRRAVARVRESSKRENATLIDRVLESVGGGAGNAQEDVRIPLRRNGAVDFIHAGEIDWVEAYGDLVKIHAGRDVHVLRETLSEIAARLEGRGFARVHRSLVVNTSRVRTVESVARGGYVLVLTSGARLRSGRRYRSAVQLLLRPGNG